MSKTKRTTKPRKQSPKATPIESPQPHEVWAGIWAYLDSDDALERLGTSPLKRAALENMVIVRYSTCSIAEACEQFAAILQVLGRGEMLAARHAFEWEMGRAAGRAAAKKQAGVAS